MKEEAPLFPDRNQTAKEHLINVVGEEKAEVFQVIAIKETSQGDYTWWKVHHDETLPEDAKITIQRAQHPHYRESPEECSCEGYEGCHRCSKFEDTQIRIKKWLKEKLLLEKGDNFTQRINNAAMRRCQAQKCKNPVTNAQRIWLGENLYVPVDLCGECFQKSEAPTNYEAYPNEQ